MNSLENIPPRLSELKKEPPFRMPPHYFDDFPGRLQYKLEQEFTAAPAEPRGKIIRLLKPIMGLAASFLLIFMLVYWPLQILTPQKMASGSKNATDLDDNLLHLLENVDEPTFYTLLENEPEKVTFNDEELISYLSTTQSEFEIYMQIK